MNEQKYTVQDYEAGNDIEDFATLEEALAYCKEAEEADKKDGDYTAGFYAVKTPDGEVIRYNY